MLAVGWLPDPTTFVSGQLSDAAEKGFASVLRGLNGAVMDSVSWIVGGVFHFFVDAVDPNVEADWFIAGHGPYRTMLTISASLLVGFVFVGIVQGVLSGDVSGLLRQFVVRLPASVLGMVLTVTLVQALIRLTDVLSTAVLVHFDGDVAHFSAVFASIGTLTGGVNSAVVVILLGFLTIVAGVIVIAELTVRSALVYLIVALAPLAFAAGVWPAMRGITRKLLELVVAVVLSKLVIAVALAVAAAGMVGVGSGGEATSTPRTAVGAEDPGGSVTQAVGLLLGATATFAVAAFSPLAVTRLFPMTEAAIVSQGVRGAPVRAAQQAMSVGYYSQATGARLTRLAAGAPAMAAGPASAALAAANAPGAPGKGPIRGRTPSRGRPPGSRAGGNSASRAVPNDRRGGDHDA